MGLFSWFFGTVTIEANNNNHDEDDSDTSSSEEDIPQESSTIISPVLQQSQHRETYNLATAPDSETFLRLLGHGNENDYLDHTYPLIRWKDNFTYTLALLQHGARPYIVNTSGNRISLFTGDQLAEMDPNIICSLEIAGLPGSETFHDKIIQMDAELASCVAYAPTTPHFPACYMAYMTHDQENKINSILDQARLFDHIATHLGQQHLLRWMVNNNTFLGSV
uniref:Uncharacterized protein n=1 Tax=viral metagenome TaxID=1070528 RepID=A0A6C0JWM2_9ZZZZ